MHVDGLIFRTKEVLDACAVPLYLMRGRPPWSAGYYTTKKRVITDAIDGNAVQAGRPLPDGFGVGVDERAVEFPWVFDRLSRMSSLGRMLDAGSTLNHDYVLDRAPVRDAKLTLMTLAPEKKCYWYRGYSYVFGDFRGTDFRDGAFNTIVSISTLEHVGLDNTLLYTSDQAKAETDKYGFRDAIREFKRLLAPNGQCLITLPFGKYENFGWFHLFDREMLDILIQEFAPSACELEFFQYKRSGWRRASEQEVIDASAFDPHSGRGRLDDLAGCARAIVCIQLTK